MKAVSSSFIAFMHLKCIRGNALDFDEDRRVRIDDWEMSEAVQKPVHEKWAEVNTENLSQISDFSGYRDEFLKLFGFGAQGVDYSAEVNQEKPIISVS